MPDILHEVLLGVSFTYRLSATYYPRDYCLMHRESDFDFASRLMAEEGLSLISNMRRALMIDFTDFSTLHPAVPGASTVAYGVDCAS